MLPFTVLEGCLDEPLVLTRDGAGYAFLADHVIALNALNPQVAARMLTALTPWRRYDTERQQSMRQQLQRIAGIENVSKDVYEVAMKSLS